MQSPRNAKPGLPFLLAEAVRSLIYTVEGSLHGRLNTLSLIFSFVKSITDVKHRAKMAGDDIQILKSIEIDIEELRNSYEPNIDLAEFAHTALAKRTAFEITLDLIQSRLMFIIQKYELIDSSMIGDVQATKWRDP